MASYSDPVLIRARLGDPDEESLPPRLVTRAQRDADAIIDSMCALQYAQQPGAVGNHLFASPFTDLVVMWSERIAAFFCMRDPLFSVQQAIDAKTIQADYDDTMTSLKAVRDRKARIPGVTAADRVNSTTQKYMPVMGLDDVENQKIDANQLDEIIARRSSSS